MHLKLLLRKGCLLEVVGVVGPVRVTLAKRERPSTASSVMYAMGCLTGEDLLAKHAVIRQLKAYLSCELPAGTGGQCAPRVPGPYSQTLRVGGDYVVDCTISYMRCVVFLGEEEDFAGEKLLTHLACEAAPNRSLRQKEPTILRRSA